MRNRKGFTTVELLTVLFGLIIVPLLIGLLALWTNSNLDFWISYFKGHAVHVPYWMAFLLTLCTNVAGIAGNLIAQIARYAV
jgi:uncharacterized membrane-anchored protein